MTCEAHMSSPSFLHPLPSYLCHRQTRTSSEVLGREGEHAGTARQREKVGGEEGSMQAWLVSEEARGGEVERQSKPWRRSSTLNLCPRCRWGEHHYVDLLPGVGEVAVVGGTELATPPREYGGVGEDGVLGARVRGHDNGRMPRRASRWGLEDCRGEGR